ncbi:MAG: hypothetical protein MI749_01770 [Desulfovibrionales bacterium]|nr:hypothetical protein [Desulfovibrionales bacterium]
MPNNVLVLYTQREDKAKATSVPHANAFRLRFTRDLTKNCAVISHENLPTPVLREYDILYFLAHGTCVGSGTKRRGVMTATGGKGRCSGMKVCNSSIAATINRYQPKFVLFIVCTMGTGSTFKAIFDRLAIQYPAQQTCLLCGHTDATPFLRDLPLSLFGNRFYGWYQGATQIDLTSSVATKELRAEFDECCRRGAAKESPPPKL